MSPNLELLTDGFLALLLLVTIGYAVVLNRKLAALRDLRGDMEGAVAAFAEAQREAEQGLAELRDRAEVLSVELREQVGSAAGRLDEARGLADDLHFLVDKGQSLADRLERAVAGGRHLAAAAAPATGAPAGAARTAPTLRAERPRTTRQPAKPADLGPAAPTSAVAAASAAAPAPAAAGDPTRRELIDALDSIR